MTCSTSYCLYDTIMEPWNVCVCMHMNVCMYICMYARMYICMYACIYLYVCMYVIQNKTGNVHVT